MSFRLKIFAALVHFLRSFTAATDITLQYSGLYPENGASVPHTGMMYFSSLYRASVVKYDPKKGTFTEIVIPSVTGQQGTHVSAIESDRSRPMIWAVVDAAAAFETGGRNLSGPAALVSINMEDKVVNYIDLKPVISQAQTLNGGSPIGGTQDLTTDLDGNLFVIESYGQAIFKVDRKTWRPSVFFAQKKPSPEILTYSGIELAHKNKLLVWNDEFSRIETFSLTSENPQPYIPDGGKTPRAITGDAIFIPSFSRGTCLLVSNSNTIEVFTSRDSWKTAIHTESIGTILSGGACTFVYEMGTKIYHGVSFFGDREPRTRKSFPQGDITDSVKRACAFI